MSGSKPELQGAPCDARTRAQLVQAWFEDADLDDRTAATGSNPKCATATVALRTMATWKRRCAEQLAGLPADALIGDLTYAWRHLAYQTDRDDVSFGSLLDCAAMLEEVESRQRARMRRTAVTEVIIATILLAVLSVPARSQEVAHTASLFDSDIPTNLLLYSTQGPQAGSVRDGSSRPFWKSKRFWGGVALTALGTALDHYSTRHAEARGFQEGTRFFRRADGHLNAGRLWLTWAGLNSALLLCDSRTDEKWRWAAFGMRGLWASNSLRAAIHNLNLRRGQE
jgi:hypothetical protein